MEDIEKMYFESVKEEVIKESKKPLWPGLLFFGFFIFMSLILLLLLYLSQLTREFFGSSFSFDYYNDRYSFVNVVVFFIIGLAGIYYIIRCKRNYNILCRHFLNGTILVKKAEIIKFKYFHHMDDNTRMGMGYTIVACVGSIKYKSKKIEIISFGFEMRDIDKNYYLKRGVPYSLTDPNFNEDYKKYAEAKKSEINEKISCLRSDLEHVSKFKKKRIEKKILKLELEKERLYPFAVVYRGQVYSIGDKINVYMDPDNPRNYIM